MREIKFRAWDGKNWFRFNLSTVGHSSSMIQGLLQNDNTIVVQFTGLRDRSGNEIYEGDIIRRVDAHKPTGAHAVIFAFGGFHLSPDGITIPHTLFPERAELRYGGDVPVFEVMGNIYE